jgi:glucan phosphoethanolaminetransferase (alkaline phosphatase superfamily)
MKRLSKIAAHVLFAFGMLAFFALPANRYDWMQEMTPSMGNLPIDESSGNRTIFTALLLAAMLIAQALIVCKSKSRREMVASLALMLVASATWVWRFWA